MRFGIAACRPHNIYDVSPRQRRTEKLIDNIRQVCKHIIRLVEPPSISDNGEDRTSVRIKPKKTTGAAIEKRILLRICIKTNVSAVRYENVLYRKRKQHLLPLGTKLLCYASNTHVWKRRRQIETIQTRTAVLEWYGRIAFGIKHNFF